MIDASVFEESKVALGGKRNGITIQNTLEMRLVKL
jgi:hypothetical protein